MGRSGPARGSAARSLLSLACSPWPRNLMRWSWKIGRLAGINVYMHATFVLLILFILFNSWTEGHSVRLAVSGVVFVLVIFGCIVLHELGHALTARRYGIQTR